MTDETDIGLLTDEQFQKLLKEMVDAGVIEWIGDNWHITVKGRLWVQLLAGRAGVQEVLDRYMASQQRDKH